MNPTDENPPPPPAPPRLGPRPLPLHLAMETLVWWNSLASLPLWKGGSEPWRPELRDQAEALARDAANVDPEAFARAVDAETRRRFGHFADGVLAYRRHPRAPRPELPPAIWTAGPARLLDYGTLAPEGAPHSGTNGLPLLLVPSLVNRGYILDLTARRSLLRFLARSGIRPFLLEWGAPEERERRFTLTDYIQGPLQDAFEAAERASGQPVSIAGYCMGGLLALALALRNPGRVRALALLATPWDFHAVESTQIRLLEAMKPGLSVMIELTGVLPVDAIQAMFAGLAPFSTPAKFRRLGQIDPGPEKAAEFVALEDWLNDGVPLAGPVAAECLFGWYVDNTPAAGRWMVAGRPVVPEDIAVPTLVATPERDYIVPPASAVALALRIKQAERWMLTSGHIGMVAGSGAERLFYRPFADWLRGQP